MPCLVVVGPKVAMQLGACRDPCRLLGPCICGPSTAASGTRRESYDVLLVEPQLCRACCGVAGAASVAQVEWVCRRSCAGVSVCVFLSSLWLHAGLLRVHLHGWTAYIKWGLIVDMGAQLGNAGGIKGESLCLERSADTAGVNVLLLVLPASGANPLCIGRLCALL